MSYCNCHFAELVYRQAEKYGKRTELLHCSHEDGKWEKISWRKLARMVRLSSQAMIEFGIGVQENIGIYSQNMPQCFYTDFGAYGIRAVEVPMYPTSSPEQIKYIINEAGIRLLFVGEQLQYNNAFKVQQEIGGLLEKIIIFDKEVVRYPEDATSVYFDDFIRLGDNAVAETEAKIRRNEAQDDDLAAIIYTSGTTGVSKGVLISHANLREAMRTHDIRLPFINDHDISVCFLPLTHIFEKGWACVCLTQGIQIAINQNPKRIQQTLLEIRPTLMSNVPRFWEKVYSGVQEKMEKIPRFLKRIFDNALQTGHRYVLDYKRTDTPAPFGLSCKFHFYDKTVFTYLKKAVGLERGRGFPVAGAPLADKITEFLLSVNIPIIYGYGLSETTATVCCFPIHNYVVGSIGDILPDLEVRIDPSNDEILVRGKSVTKGYYKKPDETAKVFTPDGYFRTGDAGHLEGPSLFFHERIKELFKTSNGKYIAPQAIEMSLSGSKYIEQCAVVADGFKFVSALIVPNFDTLSEYARKKALRFDNHADLVQKEEIVRLFKAVIEESQKNFASYEKIKRFSLLTEPFSMEKGELTDTLKMRRNVIARNYAAEIERMYEG